VFNAYEHVLEKGNYPFFIIFLEIDPHHVDVNVHPSKMEVKFEDERNIYHFLLTVIRRTLATHDLVPSMDIESAGFSGGTTSLHFVQHPGSSGQDGKTFFTGGERRRIDFPLSHDSGEASSESFQLTSRSPSELQSVPQQTEVKPIWQLHNKYILAQVRSGLMIIDQHVAHERVLYERATTSFENAVPVSQQLLFPQTITLSAAEYASVKELLPYLSKLGFDMKLFGKNTIVIEGVPGDVRPGREHDILKEVLEQFKENEHSTKLGVKENIAASFACKAAVKAGDKLNHDEMNILIDQLFATTMPYVCPHGRPVVIKISIEELDKRFGRTS
jgi:DNA mismatch repair protein MutL